MTITRKDRFRMKSHLVEVLSSAEWTFDKTNLLLAEFGLEMLSDNWQGPSIADLISQVSDSVLVEIYALVMNIDEEEVEDVIDSADRGNWKDGYVRVFLSHSADHKEFIAEVAEELAVVGIHGFVAHDMVQYSKPWQAQIEQALRSMQAFVALIHPEFNNSAWCQQEVGWAEGRRVPYFAVRLGADPVGFHRQDQWPSGDGKNPKHVAKLIAAWICQLPELGPTVAEGLFKALESADNYIDAGAAAERIAALGTITNEQFGRLDVIYASNNQVWGGALPSRALRPLYQENGRPWPPPRPKVH